MRFYMAQIHEENQGKRVASAIARRKDEDGHRRIRAPKEDIVFALERVAALTDAPSCV
jgi:hypothetical protein